MGADFIYDFVPLCKLTSRRKKQLEKKVVSLIGDDFDWFEEGDDVKEFQAELLNALDEYESLDGRRDTGNIMLHDHYAVITGGMSWGDDPTDSFTIMRKISDCSKVYFLLEKWAKADYKNSKGGE